MDRKVNRVGTNTLTISLPAKWAKRCNIEPGDELEVLEEGKNLHIGRKAKPVSKSVTMDISELDRSSIIYVLQSLYRRGFDEICLTFKNPTTTHFRLNKEVTVISVIHKEVNRLVGVEVISQKDDSCTIKDISAESEKEFDAMVRRVFFLMIDMSKDFLKGTKTLDKNVISTIEERHDSITKFISYCLRILNKKGHGAEMAHDILLYHILANLDKVTDVYKYSARDMMDFSAAPNPAVLDIIERVNISLSMYYDFFYSFEQSKMRALWKNREETLQMIQKLPKKVSSDDSLLATKIVQALELIADLTGARVGLQY